MAASMRVFSAIVATLIGATALPLKSTDSAAQTAATSQTNSPDETSRKFFHDQTARDAERYEKFLGSNWQPGEKSSAAWLREAERSARTKDYRTAAGLYAAAVVKEPKNATAWLGLARALLNTKPSTSRERYDLPANASGAAYIAYQRATKPREKAAALAQLGAALARRSFWRPAINAYKASLDLAANAAVNNTYKRLRDQYGFRITDYSVNSDATSPRLCVQFSEPLDRRQNAFSKYFSVNGKDPIGVRAEARQICMEGFQHGQRYEVSVRSGIPSTVGEKLQKNAQLRIYVKDRSPSVRFTGRNYVLPTRGQQGIPIVSVNANSVKLNVFRVADRSLVETVTRGQFLKKLSTWSETEIEQKARKVWNGMLDVRSVLNENVTTAFPVTETLGTLSPGVYVMTARPDPAAKGNRYGDIATQWFVVSDLGLTSFSGDNGVHAIVRSLATAQPKAGAKVRLVAKDNEILATAKTNENGHVTFDAGLSRGTGGAAPALLVATTAQGDYAFLNLAAPAFDLTDRGDAGKARSKANIQAFLFSERGVYRGGEQVHFTSLMRKADARAAQGLPAMLILTRPDGVEYRRIRLNDAGGGAHIHTAQLGTDVMTGTWQARLHLDPKQRAIGTTSFLVEDFVPERLAMTLEAKDETLSATKTADIQVDGKYLFGPPAANLMLEGDVLIRKRAKGLKGYPGYRFGLTDKTVVPVRKKLNDLGKTDAKGRARLAVRLPTMAEQTQLLEARTLVRLREPGGRSIERAIVLPVSPQTNLIGIKPTFKGMVASSNAPARFEIVALDQSGKPMSGRSLRYEFFKLNRTFQWYNQNGSWQYQPVDMTTRVSSDTIITSEDGTTSLSLPVEWGRYRIEVSSPDERNVASAVTFTAGFYATADADTPEKLSVSLDRKAYTKGDKATVSIESRHDGQALIAILRDGVESTRNVAVKKGTNRYTITVGDWGAGAYVSATLFRPMDVKARRMPARALGLAWLAMDAKAAKLDVKLNAPTVLPSGTTLRIPITVANAKPNEAIRLTVSAVDVGILNLTRHKAPKPLDRFFAQTRLGVDYRDLYGRLIDGMSATRGTVRSGGDGGNALQMSGNPTSEVTIAEFSGLVTLDATGKGVVEFELPPFNGTVRTTAVAWSDNRLGSSTAETTISDPVAMLVSRPRFLHLGDKASVGVDLHSLKAPSGAFQLTVTSPDDPSLRMTQSVTLAKGDRRLERIAIEAGRLGDIRYDLSLSGPGDTRIARSFTLKVHPPAQNIRRRSTQKLAARNGTLRLSADLVKDFIPESTRVSISVGPFAGIDLPGLYSALNAYPYGCAEQTTSRALPLLYLSRLEAADKFMARFKVRKKVADAIARLSNLQSASGAFGLWRAGNGNIWLTAYVTDFLSRAKEQKFAVDPRILNQALDRLENHINFANDVQNGGKALAYALYVLSRNGRTPVGNLRYFADTRLDAFKTPLARAMLGAALAMYGDRERAGQTFTSAIALLKANAQDNGYRDDFGTRLRDGAAILTLASETQIDGVNTNALADLVSQLRAGTTVTSTQEKSWLLLAASTLADQARNLKLDVNGTPITKALIRSFTGADLARDEQTIRNLGPEALGATVTVTGDALTPEPAIARGFSIERSYHTLDGKKVDLEKRSAAGSLKQNDRFVVVLKIMATDGNQGRVLLEDRLPAGFSIDNPRLVEGGTITGLDWLQTAMQPAHSEFRDEKFAAAFDMTTRQKTTATVAYLVRATSPGTFALPAASVEDMYRPSRFARTDAATIEIAPR